MAQQGQALVAAPPDSHPGSASWQGDGRALRSTDRRTALFWEPMWALSLPPLGPGNSAFVAPAEEIPREAGAATASPVGVGFPPPRPWPTLVALPASHGSQHCPGTSWLKVDGPSLTCHKTTGPTRALPSCGPARAAMAGTLRASESWHQVKLRHSMGTDGCDHALLA